MIRTSRWVMEVASCSRWKTHGWTPGTALSTVIAVFALASCTPAQSSGAKPTPIVARAATSTTVAATSVRLVALQIATPTHANTYNRAHDFGPFTDADHDCQNARAEVLIRISSVPVTFTTARRCTVKTGKWVDPWSGDTRTDARDLQIDHTVPLENAWVSGAWAWTHAQRVEYANDITDTDHLVPVLVHNNESKGDNGPEDWRPPRRGAWCRYALDWDRIKAKWRLSATAAEWATLRNMAASC